MSMGKDDRSGPMAPPPAFANRDASPGRVGIHNLDGNPANSAEYYRQQQKQQSLISSATAPVGATQPGGYPTSAQYKTLLGA